jgi:hypothetical protein
MSAVQRYGRNGPRATRSSKATANKPLVMGKCVPEALRAKEERANQDHVVAWVQGLWDFITKHEATQEPAAVSRTRQCHSARNHLRHAPVPRNGRAKQSRVCRSERSMDTKGTRRRKPANSKPPIRSRSRASPNCSIRFNPLAESKGPRTPPRRNHPVRGPGSARPDERERFLSCWPANIVPRRAGRPFRVNCTTRRCSY